MSQHDYNIANAPGATVRADINALAEAMASQNAGNSAPSVTFPFMLWADTTNALLKIRNPANSGWITLASISGSTFTLDDSAIRAPASTDWFGTNNRIPRIDTSGVMEVGKTVDFHPDAAGSEDYRYRLDRATGANGAMTFTQSGTGVVNFVQSGEFQINGVSVATIPLGAYVICSGSTLPPKCIWANGQNISRSTYVSYFTLVLTTYGAGNGSSTFGTPDVRGRVVAGKDDMGGSAANRLTGASGGVSGTVLGAAGGAETHVLTIAQLAAHAHVYGPKTGNYGANGQTYSDFRPSMGDSDRSSATITTTTVGSDAAHNNVQPTIIGNVAIYVGV